MTAPRSLVIEPEHIQRARTHAVEIGAHPISAGIGAQCAVVAAATAATSMVEIGTGAGVSGLWLLHGAPGAILTTIDSEPESPSTKRRFRRRAPALSRAARWTCCPA